LEEYENDITKKEKKKDLSKKPMDDSKNL